MPRRAPKLLACRYCGATCDRANRDTLSHWTHAHPAECPYREDAMPALNGVHVGDQWRNLHTRKVSTVEALKLGGCGTYTDREPVAVLVDEEKPSEWRYVSPTPLWSLVEHYEPLTRPGEYPMPWDLDPRFPPDGRSALAEWRTPGYRHPDDPERDEKPHAYWHARHVIRAHCSEGWEWWQIDAAALDPEEIPDPDHDEQMALAV